MKASDLIEAIQTADRLFQEKNGTPLEIMDMVFNEDEYDGDVHIFGCGKVHYRTGGFGYGEKVGKRPHSHIRIHFEVEDGKITDRAVTFGDEP